MATVAESARPVGAPPPPVRHGLARLTLRIGGSDYRLRPMPAPPGFRAVWVLRKLDPRGEVTYSVAAPKGQPAGCTCPDHEHNGATCKHIMALAALGLIPRPKAARPKVVSPARARQLHAKNARQAIAEANALPVEARRHLAEIATAPAPVVTMPEGWQTGGDYERFAAGFRQAVRAHVARLGRGGYEICDGCGADFDPEISGHPGLCFECAKEGEA
jgi:SWIM zinc finger